MNRGGYVIGTTLVLALIGALFGLVWDFFSGETGWWGAWGLLGLILGMAAGLAVAERRRV